jgi:hypothetical protein
MSTPRTTTPPGLTGPQFSSYAADDVTWLLTDLSDITLEQPTAERERQSQTGGHYSATLPIEYVPSEEYFALYQDGLARSARRMAESVATVATLIRRHYGDGAVLVSLARAGTPIGVLLRRYAKSTWGLDWKHYTISIIRDKGIDTAALAHIQERHDPANVVFVDGWTGKGAITRQLQESLIPLSDEGWNPSLSVLADPGHCAQIAGTRDDFLIPSACLNSTVSGLVSRTVYRPDLTGAGAFNGAKFYRDLLPADVSNEFLDTICTHFSTVSANDNATWTEPEWTGWKAVESIGQDLSITNMNLIKPGVGETTRVLLRRIPWRIYLNPEHRHHPDLQHIITLATERNVPILDRPGLPYSCVGVIEPQQGTP